VTRNETLLHELSSERMHYNEGSERLAAESRALKSRVQDLEQWLQAVQSFLGRHADSAAEGYGDGDGAGVGGDLDGYDAYPDEFENRDIFDSDAYPPSRAGAGARPPLERGVSWSGDVASPPSPDAMQSPPAAGSPRGSRGGSPRGSGLRRLSFGVSGTFVSSGNWDSTPDSQEDAELFREQKERERGESKAAAPRSPAPEGDGAVDLSLKHVSSLRKLFPLPTALSMESESDYKLALAPDKLKIDPANAPGRRRLEAVYDRAVGKPSLGFLRLRFGLKALKTSWVHSVNEDYLLRNYLVDIADQNYSSSHSSDRNASKVSRQVAFLQARVAELEAARDDVVQTYGALRRRIEEADEELSAAREQYADLSVALEGVTGAGEVLQSERAVLRAQFDNMQLDYDTLFYERNNMVLSAKRMKLNMNELQLSNDLLQGKLDQVMQRLSITVVQRDELVRQFIDNGKFEEDEHGVETLTTPGEGGGGGGWRGSGGSPGSPRYGDLSDDDDSAGSGGGSGGGGGGGSVLRAIRRRSSFRSDGSDRFVPWS
jgi:hypothetical protein